MVSDIVGVAFQDLRPAQHFVGIDPQLAGWMHTEQLARRIECLLCGCVDYAVDLGLELGNRSLDQLAQHVLFNVGFQRPRDPARSQLNQRL
ncbi:hypothetical protein AW168_40890 [Nocardia brasiliensis]|uniref:Uncharacterized protein n=1 Tax=Nocardia brasiliensis (strain ATCC 700358 / HUJEG-1) TaxID=1133849 RepID=K0F5T3_NOCB7|nr:hypothetical protein O3I_024280 [Nocardia brasiliensis ATCC 700358]OCF84557.1 hypothetical protein AW168_40890 [Nocardia brasiliensis]